jgi:hypothetical protein
MSIRFLKYDTRFLAILFWETLENAPLLIGFLLAIRVHSENLALAFVYLFVGIALGVGLIHVTEVKKFSNQPTMKETLINFVVFMVLAIPFLFYFSSDGVWWSNWITDIVLGVIAGSALAVGESWGWRNTATVKAHAVSMAITAILFLLGIRLTHGIESITTILILSVVFNLFISIIIVWIDYWPIKESTQIAA